VDIIQVVFWVVMHV